MFRNKIKFIYLVSVRLIYRTTTGNHFQTIDWLHCQPPNFPFPQIFEELHIDHQRVVHNV